MAAKENMMLRRITGNSVDTLTKALDSRPQLKAATEKTVNILGPLYGGFSVVFVICVVCAFILWSFETPVVVKEFPQGAAPTVVQVDRGTVKLMDLLMISNGKKASYSAELQDIDTGEVVYVFPQYVLPRKNALKHMPVYFPESLPQGKYVFQAEMHVKVNPVKTARIDLDPVVVKID